MLVSGLAYAGDLDALKALNIKLHGKQHGKKSRTEKDKVGHLEKYRRKLDIYAAKKDADKKANIASSQAKSRARRGKA